MSGADSHRPFCERTESYDSYTATLAAAAACVGSGAAQVSILIHLVVLVTGLRHEFPSPPQCEILWPHPKHTRLEMPFSSSGNSFCTSKATGARKGSAPNVPTVQPTRAATHLSAGIEGSEHASISLLRTSNGQLCLARNDDWRWEKLLKLGSFGRRSD